MKKYYLAPLYVLLISILFVRVVSAEEVENNETEGSETPRVTREERQQQRSDAREQKMETREVRQEENAANREQNQEARAQKRCEVVSELINKRVEIFKKTKTNHQENYDKLLSRLNEVSTKLNEKGLDTTNLNSDIATLTTMVSEYKTKYDSFVTQLEQIQEVVCGENATTYKDTLEQTKTMLQELRQLRIKIREFYLTEVREDLKLLRQQAEQASDQETEQQSTDTSKEGDQ